MEFFIASLWVVSPQGRIGPIEGLNLEALRDLRRQGHTTSRNFKTVTTSDQRLCVVLFPKMCMTILEMYMKFLRPVAQRRSTAPAATDPLLLNYEGNRLANASRLLTTYFSSRMQLHITSTQLRSMVETEADQRTDLSQEQKDAIHQIVGHSNKVAQEFYIYKETTNNARIAAAAFEEPGGDEMELITTHVPAPLYCAPVWGKDHPDFSKPPGSKARWTAAEKDGIVDIVSELQESPGKHQTALMAEVLKVIKQRVQYRPIFHATHVFNSARLRSGYAPLSQRKRSSSREREDDEREGDDA